MPYPITATNDQMVLLLPSFGYLTFNYSVDKNICNIYLSGKEDIDQKVCDTFPEWKSSLRALKPKLRDVDYVRIVAPGRPRLCQAIDVEHQGISIMQEAKAEFDLFSALSQKALNTDDRYAIIRMSDDRARWSNTNKFPVPGLTFPAWIDGNQNGHDKQELVRYKNALHNWGNAVIPVSELDLDHPDLSGFKYQAFSLVDYGRIECCVDAWIGVMDGELVRIVKHVRPPRRV
ncbi:MAG: hypothetical protein AAGA75_18650 [Cyanobacteria bacterium P01_E01_bin.6]